MLPLEKLKVLDLTQVMAGPFCCQVLADMGAVVTKVEPPETGEQSRRSMGFRMKKGEDTAAFIAINRNKKSMTLNLKEDEAREIFYRLAREADVVVENYRPEVTKKLGVDYETLREVNPRIIYASVSGFGQTGPYAMRAGYDLIAQGMSGVMSVTGEPDGTPAKCGIPIGDLSAGLFCAFGILTAYIAREETGRGQYIDTSLFEGALAFSIWETAELWATGRIPKPFGSAHRLTAPYQALKTRDGYINVGANNQRLWARLCNALGPRGPSRGRALRHQRRPDEKPHGAGRRAGEVPRGEEHGRVDGDPAGGRYPRGAHLQLQGGLRGSAHISSRDDGGDGSPGRGDCKGARHSRQVERDAREDPARRTAARRAHRGSANRTWVF